MTRASLLHDCFDLRWRDWRDRIAIDIPPGRDRPRRTEVSYADLARLSTDVELRLRPFVSPDAIVAVFLPRTTPEAFAAPLGALRAGAAYTCIEPSFPDGRIRELIADAAPAAIVTDRAGADRLEATGIDPDRFVLVGDAEAQVAGQVPTHPRPDRPPQAGSLAYVIYTSGTTGRPKGVMIEHRAVVNLVHSDVEAFGIGPGDRVGQGSSHAYDSAVEETWLALAAGATLVVLDDDVVRAGPDLIAWLERERITVLCPPPTQLRATGRRDPAGLLPRLRLLYVGGEALTDDIVRVWAPGRRLVNGYGPTECAVVAVRAEVVPGQPVAIGAPVPNVTAHVLNDDRKAVADGEIGELYLGGTCLARGYLGDDDLTAARFPVDPALGRLYRTGDLARRTADGTLYCLGRADSQVKIRGYRVELEEVEARLAHRPGVRAAACTIQDVSGRSTLVAFVVPADSASPPDRDRLRRDLADDLPSYMVPAQIEVIDEVPTTTGGKVDRRVLPIVRLAQRDRPIETGGDDPLPARIESAIRRVAEYRGPLPADENLFELVGGDSLFAAELVTAFRADAETAALTVRDVYEAPTLDGLVARAAQPAPSFTAAAPSEPTPAAGHARVATIVQTAWLMAELFCASAATYLLVVWLTPLAAPLLAPWRIALAIPLIGLAGIALYASLSVAVAVAVKRLLIGRYRPARESVWSGLYVRNWIVCQTVQIVPWPLLSGTWLQNAVLRLLGARIGERVHIHRGADVLTGGWDLLEIGDDVVIGQEASIRLVDLERGHVVIAPVTLGDGVTIETRASVAGGAAIERHGYLAALSSLPAGGRIPAGERWDGVPAAQAGTAPEPAAPDRRERTLTPAAHGLLMLGGRLAGVLLMPTIFGVALAWMAGRRGVTAGDVAAWIAAPVWPAAVLWALAAAAAITVPVSVVVQAAAVRLLGRLPSGSMSRWSLSFLRVWTKTDIVERAGTWLSGTLMWPMWLRAAGMRVGRDCEISTIIDVVPELVSIGDGTFFADGVYLGGPILHRGVVTLADTQLGAGVFLGNHVVIPAGATVADGVLIGVSTVARQGATRPGTAWFGHPPFALSRGSAAPPDRRLTHDPSVIRRINRWLWELGRFLVPIAQVALLMLLLHAMLMAHAAFPVAIVAALAAPVLVAATGLLSVLLVLALKWTLLGRVRPGQHALWSCWCSRWDFLYVVWGKLARAFLARFDGTLLLATYLRAMGMRIGRRVVLGSGFAQVVDPDMIQIDDGATVHALFQAHTFEDRILKIDRIRIRAHATVGCGAVLFYGADVGQRTEVAPQSVIMKHERLVPNRRYEGCPCATTAVAR